MSAITLYTGKTMDITTPQKENIDIADIAHSLSMICRANGHFKSFYSVAQHCINCAAEAYARGYSKAVQLACLLHDAAEAYVCDIPRPIKNGMADFCLIEDRLLDMIYRNYLHRGLTAREQAEVKEIDDTMLCFEFDELMGKRLDVGFEPYLLSQPRFDACDCRFVERYYARLVKELVREMELCGAALD